MTTRGTGNGRLVMIGVGVGVAGIVVGVAMSGSADEAAPTATPSEPVIAMPPPSLAFDDLAAEPPPTVAADVTTTASGPAARSLRFRGALTIDVEFAPLDSDRRTTYTMTGTIFGDVTGEWVEEGWEQYGEVDDEGHVRSVGSGTATVEMTVPGVGTGRVNATNEWQSDNRGNVLGVSTMTSGSGDLEGVTGTMRWNTTQDGDALTYQLDLTVPDP